MKLFSEGWAQEYAIAINRNSAYRKASERWNEGSVALLLNGSDAAIWLDLQQGVCREAKVMSHSAAISTANFVIQADASTWQEVLSGNLQPLMGIMRGKLKLTKGSIGKLLPHTTSATELVNSAKNIQTDF